jgi:hypothetical protein
VKQEIKVVFDGDKTNAHLKKSIRGKNCFPCRERASVCFLARAHREPPKEVSFYGLCERTPTNTPLELTMIRRGRHGVIAKRT